MGVVPRPYLVLNGKQVAGNDSGGRSAIVLAGLRLNQGARDSSADQATWPTATVQILAESDFGPAQRPMGLPAEIHVSDGSNTARIFKGMVDKASVTAVREEAGSRRFNFQLTLQLISHPAVSGDVRFNNSVANNRPAETMRSRLEWINRALMEEDNKLLEYAPNKPLFDAVSGAAGFWNYYVQPKDYRLQPAIAAGSELALCAGEFTEYFPAENRLSARGRSIVDRSLARLGWRAGFVDLTKDPSAPGKLIQGDTVPMGDSDFSDAGTVGSVEVATKAAYNGLNGDLLDIEWSATVNADQNRTARITSLGLHTSGSGGGQATANAFAGLYADAAEPYHPPVTSTWEDGWETWALALDWLGTNSYRFGPVYVARSVFNRLRPGQAYHARGSLDAVWEACGPTGEQRRWRTVMGLTPIKNNLGASLLIGDINPSAEEKPPSEITYTNAPGNPPLQEFASLPIEDLAAALAALTSSAFAYEDIAPSLTLDEFATATRGI